VLAAAVLAGSDGVPLARVAELSSARTAAVVAAVAEVLRPGVDPLGPPAGSTMTRSGD
jgi:hypothetical protein